MAARRKAVSVPWGGAVLAEARKRAAAGWSAGLTTLTGDDLYHLDLAQELLLDTLIPDRGDAFAWTVFADGKVPAAHVVEAASSRGMFSPRRVVLVRDVGVLEGDPEPIVSFAASPPDGAYLIVRAPKLDGKRRLHQALTGGVCLTFRPPESPAEEQALLREIVAMGKERGQNLDAPGAAVLAESCGGDLLRVGNELDRLRDWAGEPSHRWSRKELEEHLGSSATVTGWEVGDALVRRERGGAWVALRQVLEAGSEPIPVVGGLAWRARVFIASRARVAAREPVDSVVGSSRAWGWADALRDGLRRWSLDDALGIPSRLLQADRELKSRGLSGASVVESAVEDLLPPSGQGAVGPERR